MPRIRSSRLLILLACISLFALLVGCDSGTSTPADTPDAASGPVNALGTPCTVGAANACPSDPGHVCGTLSSIGSQTEGYCSPVCITATECTTGYTGPATGQLSCFGQTDNQQRCVIGCTTGTDCPTGLQCLAPPGAPMAFCVQ